MAFSQWLWIKYTPEDRNILSSRVLTLHHTGAISFDGLETGGKWSYRNTSAELDCLEVDSFDGQQFFFMEFHSLGKPHRACRHCFQQISFHEAVLLPNDHEAYTIVTWSPESIDHKNKLDILIKKIELPKVSLLNRRLHCDPEAEDTNI